MGPLLSSSNAAWSTSPRNAIVPPATTSIPKRSAFKKVWHWTHLHLIAFLLSISGLLTIFLGVLLYLFIALDIPNIKSLKNYQPPMTSVILDAKGVDVDRVYNQNRTVVPYARMPELLVKSFVAAEDARFFEHSGLDGWSILRALFNNLRSGDRGQGGRWLRRQHRRRRDRRCGELRGPERSRRGERE